MNPKIAFVLTLASMSSLSSLYGLDISGKVLSKTWAPVPEARICLQASPATCVSSAADGTFRIQGGSALRPGQAPARGFALEWTPTGLGLLAPESIRAQLEWFDAAGHRLGSAAMLDLAPGRNALEVPQHVGLDLLFLHLSAPGLSMTWKAVLPVSSSPRGERSENAPPGPALAALAKAPATSGPAPSALLVSKAGFAGAVYQPANESETDYLVVLGGEGEKVALLFDGKTLGTWIQSAKSLGNAPGSWVVKDGALHSQGTVRGVLTSQDDFLDYRMLFAVRHLPTDAGKGDHQPCTLIWGDRSFPNDAMGAIQFQVPNGGHWDYRVGQNTGNPGNEFTGVSHPTQFDNKQWHQCEIVTRSATGEAHMACCRLTGNMPCKGEEVLRFKNPAAVRKGPFGFQVHNPGLHDEYKNVVVETDPATYDLITTK